MLQTEAYAVTYGEGLDEHIIAIYFLTEEDRAEAHAGRIDGRVRPLKGMQGKALFAYIVKIREAGSLALIEYQVI